MKENDLNAILVKFFTKSISKEEDTELNKWINKSETNASTFQNLKKVWKERTVEPELVNSDSLIDEIWAEGVKKNQKSIVRPWNMIYKVAALLIIFLVAGFLVTRELMIHQSNEIRSLDELVTKTSQPGVKTRIVLSEGSTIYLNSGSEIRYQKNFTDTSRIIHLKGEAFIEVAHDKDRPFTVITDMSTTKALGTSFNINTHYHETDQIALFEGKVEVVELVSGTPMLLNKGEMAEINYGKDIFQKSIFDESIVGGWKNGILIFNAASFEDFRKKVELWYDITVLVEGTEPRDWKLTAQYEKETLENILLNLRFEKDFNYEIVNDSLTLKF